MSIVRTLHHFPLDPASRQVRLSLAEKRLPFEQAEVRYWERPVAFMALNPSGLTPVLVEQTGDQRVVVCEVRAILEHLEAVAPSTTCWAPPPRTGPKRGG